MFNLFKTKKTKAKLNNKEDVEDSIERSKQIINAVFYPIIEKQLNKLNDHLQSKYKVRVGIEINWFFEKID